MTTVLALPQPLDAIGTAAVLQFGVDDLTCRVSEDVIVRSCMTPHGATTVRLTVRGSSLQVETWGDGGPWVVDRVPGMVGLEDPVADFQPPPSSPLSRLLATYPGFRLTRTGDLFGSLVTAIASQGASVFQAHRAHRQLLVKLGSAAPGPFPDLRALPSSNTIAGRGAYELHKIGFEPTQASTLLRIAASAQRFSDLRTAQDAREAVAAIDGLDRGSAELAILYAFGDPDALPLGDPHRARRVSLALTGEPDGDDDHLVALLEPWTGQRGRIVQLVEHARTSTGSPVPDGATPSLRPRSA